MSEEIDDLEVNLEDGMDNFESDPENESDSPKPQEIKEKKKKSFLPLILIVVVALAGFAGFILMQETPPTPPVMEKEVVAPPEPEILQVDPIVEELKTLQSINKTLESRVEVLESRLADSNVQFQRIGELSEKVSVLESKVTNLKPVIIKPKKTFSKKSEIPLFDNETELLKKTKAVEKAQNKTVDSSCIAAVVEGRVWLRKTDGTTSSYAPGDTLPDGKQLTVIDVDEGKVYANNKAWSCPSL